MATPVLKADNISNERLSALRRRLYVALLFIALLTSLLAYSGRGSFSQTRFDLIATPVMALIVVGLLIALLTSRRLTMVASWLVFLIPAGFFVCKYAYLILTVSRGEAAPADLLTVLPWAVFSYAYAYLTFGRRRGLIASGALLVIQGLIGLTSYRVLGDSLSVQEVLFTLLYTGALALVVFYFFTAIIERQADELATSRLDAHYANRDALTNLPNRLALQQELEDTIEQAQRSRRPVGVFFVDLDRFKAINDTLGHAVGDALLRQVAQRLRSAVRSHDLVGRLSGDEFTVVCADCDSEAVAERIANKLLERLRLPFDLGDQTLTITASIGVSLLPHHGLDVSELLSKADSAMAQAKQSGKNRYRVFSTAIGSGTLGRSKMERSLRRAFEANELTLMYQPIFDATSSAVVSFETLLRWTDDELGVVSPTEFIPVAEGSGLITAIGAWVLENACRQVKLWQDRTHASLRVAVNISAFQLTQADFVDDVKRVLEQSELAPHYLELEVTEGVVVEPAAIERLSHLRSLGVGVLVDDFGTGYSSLAYLQKLPIDGLKIDKSFIHELSASGTAYGNTLVETIVRLAHTLSRTVVAEGVETREQLEILRAFGCHKVQGYHLSKPMSPEEIDLLLLGQGSGTVFLYSQPVGDRPPPA